MFPRALPSVLLITLLIPVIGAQNEPGDECIIQVTLHDDLRTVTIAYDLLFDDAAWANLTARVDTDGDGVASRAEIERFEQASYEAVDGDALPASRSVNLRVEFSHGSYTGWAAERPLGATNQTFLINFEGPVDEREGKTVRETWIYQFPDPLEEYDTTSRARAYAIEIAWGPEAQEAPDDSIAVIEIVQVEAPAGWWVVVDGERHERYTFASGDGYRILFEPDQPPKEPFLPVPFAGVAVVALLLLAFVRLRR